MTTPFALQLTRAFTKALAFKETEARALESLDIFSRLKCFDITAVQSVIGETADELRKALKENWISHGGLLFLPAKDTWIEYNNGSGNVGFLLKAGEDGIDFSVLSKRETLRSINGLSGKIIISGDLFQVGANKGLDLTTRNTLAISGLIIVAALLLINAPRGVDRKKVSSNYTLASQLKKLRRGPLLQEGYTITLSTIPGDVSGRIGHVNQSPRMFHFCRSHVRNLSEGKTTVVKAHWRGDPSLGIKKGDYKLI